MKRMVKIYRMGGTHSTQKNGLFGNEQKIYMEMFEDDKKTPKKFSKLNNSQKKVLRKLGINSGIFIND